MDVEVALNFVNELLVEKFAKRLSDTEKVIFKYAWEDLSYSSMVDDIFKNENRIVDDANLRKTGNKLFQLIGKLWDLPPKQVRKKTFRAIVEQQWKLHQSKKSETTSKPDLNRDSSSNKESEKKFDKVLKIADSELIVVKGILISWGLDEIVKNFDFHTLYISYDWSDKILDDLNVGKIQIAIYNTVRTKQYLKNKSNQLEIVDSYGFSMGGKNFYILSNNESLIKRDTTVNNFIKEIEGSTIALPFESDIYDNLLHIMNLTREQLDEHNINLIDLPVSYGLDIFKFKSDLLLLSGQNVRFKAKYKGGFFELNTDHILNDKLKSELAMNSANCLVINKRIYQYIDDKDVKDIFNKCKINFYSNWTEPILYDFLIDKIVHQLYNKMKSYEEAKFIVKQILFETYRFGEPLV